MIFIQADAVLASPEQREVWLRNRVLLAATLLVLSAGPAFAVDNGPDSVGGDLQKACLASHEVCIAACKRSGTSVSGTLQQSFCESDCDDIYIRCEASIEFRRKTGPLVNKGNGTVFR